MKFAVIAAGEGTRLQAEGIALPKPLVRVGSERLIERLLRIFMENDAEEVVVICNGHDAQTLAYLQERQALGLPLRIVVQSTPSSMHSLWAMRPFLSDAPFCLTTVDTVFGEEAFARYLCRFREVLALEGDGLMGVTDYVDDEKPLYVRFDDAMGVQAFADVAATPEDTPWVSAGVYGLTPRCWATLQRCVERGEQRMRNFQRALLADGLVLEAFPMGMVMDVDHASDIDRAAQLIDFQTKNNH